MWFFFEEDILRCDKFYVVGQETNLLDNPMLYDIGLGVTIFVGNRFGFEFGTVDVNIYLIWNIQS